MGILGNGKSIIFWTYRWLGTCALSSSFPNLFSIALDTHITVAEVLTGGSITKEFRRQLTGLYRLEWQQLLVSLATVTIDNTKVDF